MPILNKDGFIMSNIYALPLVKGSITLEVLKILNDTVNVYNFLNDLVSGKVKTGTTKFVYLEYVSVLCRVLDAFREVFLYFFINNLGTF